MKGVKFVFDTLKSKNIIESEIRAAICTNKSVVLTRKNMNLILEEYLSAEYFFYIFKGINSPTLEIQNLLYTDPFKYDKTLKGSIVAAVSRSITHRLAINANRRSSTTFQLRFFS